MTNKRIKTIIQVLVFLCIGIGLIFWQFNKLTTEEKQGMYHSIQQVKWIYLLPVALISFLSHFLRALRWKQLLQPLKINAGTANTTFAVLIGYLVNLLVPRAGEVAKCTILAKYEKVPADKMIGTIVAERAFDTVCLAIIALLTLVVQYDIVFSYAAELWQGIASKFFVDANGNTQWTKIMLLCAFGLLCIILFIVLAKKSKGTKIGKIIDGILSGLQSITLVKNKILFLIYTIGIWFCYTIIINILFWAMQETSQVFALASLSIIVFGSVAMILTPGGVGAYPPIVASILMLYGVPFVTGTAFGWLSWLVQTILIIIFGLISLIALFIYNNKTKNGTIQTQLD